MERMNPAGTPLRWRLTLNALNGGPIPFLIDWGHIEHPSRSAPQGLRLERFEIEHPDPDELGPVLAALDADIAITRADAVPSSPTCTAATEKRCFADDPDQPT
jgi:hypothetical protein